MIKKWMHDKGGSLPGCMAEQQAQLATRPLAAKVAAARQRFSATPTAGDTPATPPDRFIAEVRE
jgi:hypothetical protein